MTNVADAFDHSDIFELADAAAPLTPEEEADHLAFFDGNCMGCLTNSERPYSPDSRPELALREVVARYAPQKLDAERYTRAGSTVVL
jgi:hypothetical protein